MNKRKHHISLGASEDDPAPARVTNPRGRKPKAANQPSNPSKIAQKGAKSTTRKTKKPKVTHELADADELEELDELTDPQSEEPSKDAAEKIANWSKDTDLTSSLLSIIEEDMGMRQAFAFSTDGTTVNSHGKKATHYHLELAVAVLNLTPEQRKVTATVNAYKRCVKNRIAALKRDWVKYRDELRETGHGLVMEDKDVTGTPFENAWAKTQAAFPWYIRMSKLMGASPVVNKDALANSTTDLDPSIFADVLGEQQHISPAPGSACSSPPPDAHQDLPELDIELMGMPDVELDEPMSSDTTLVAPKAVKTEISTPVKVEPGAQNSSQPRGGRKNMVDIIGDVQRRSSENRIELLKLSASAKQERTLAKEKIKLEREKVKAAARLQEARERREHERWMKMQDLQLARVTHGQQPSSSEGSSSFQAQDGAFDFSFDPPTNPIHLASIFSET